MSINQPTNSAVTVTRKELVARVAIDRPKVNALSISVLSELEHVFKSLDDDPPGAVLVVGTDRLFSAGADVNELADPSTQPAVIEAFGRTLDRIAAFRRATVAVVFGAAYGGGLELALACDFRFAAEGAQFGFPEVLIGMMPGAGGTQRVTRLIGPSRAKEMIFTGRAIQAAEAMRIGLVDRVVEAEELNAVAAEFARGLSSGAVVAQSLAKYAIDGGIDLPLSNGLALERRLFGRVIKTDDARSGLQSFVSEGPGHARFIGK